MSNRQASSFTGFLIKDPELIKAKSEDDRPLAKVTMFHTENRPVKDTAGTITSWEETASVAVTAFARGNLANNVVNALRKGDLVTVSGSWHFDQWTDEKVPEQFRTPRTSITVNADDIAASLKNPAVSVVNAAMVKAAKDQGKPLPAVETRPKTSATTTQSSESLYTTTTTSDPKATSIDPSTPPEGIEPHDNDPWDQAQKQESNDRKETPESNPWA